MTSFRLAALFWCFVTLNGAADIFLLPSSIADSSLYFLITAIIWLTIAFAWFLEDAQANGIKTTRGLRIAVLLLYPITLPYYKFRYFGLRAGLKFIGFILLGCLFSFSVLLVGLAITGEL